MTDKQKKYWDKIMNILNNPENEDIIWIQDLCALVPMSTVNFYELFQKDSNEFNAIKELLEKNRIALNKFTTKILKSQAENESTTAAIYLNKISQSKEQKEHMQELKEQETAEKPAPISVNFVLKNKEDENH